MAALVPPFEVIPKSGTNPALKLQPVDSKNRKTHSLSLLAVGSIRAGLLLILPGRPLTPEAL